MENNQDFIDLRIVFKKIKSRKKLFAKTTLTALILSSLWIFPQPRYYTTSITLAPEMDNMASGGTLSSIASSFGFNIGNAISSDAIYPTLYPDLMETSNFIVSIFDINVKNEDGDINTNYYTYLKKHQKVSIWNKPFIWIGKQIKSVFKKKDKLGNSISDTQKGQTFILSEEQHNIVDLIRDNITCSVDKKTDVITISVKDQDRLICATMADSVRVRLQNFITEYRTKKARIDLEYYTQLAENAKADYDKARKQYASFADANTNPSLTSIRSKQDDLENNMQLKYSAYTTICTQLEIAKAKVQERTPAFTILQGAMVPQKPAGPKRIIFIFAMVFLTCIGTVIYVFKEEITKQITHLK